MRSVILTVSVLLSGSIGAFLLRLAERHIAERAASAGPEETEGSPVPLGRSGLGVQIGCFLSGGAMAVFLELFYHSTILNTVNILLLCSVLWSCAWADLQARMIPNPVLLFGFLLRCGVLSAELLLLPGEVLLDLIRSGVGAVALCAVALLCRLAVPGSVGFGDVKLLMLMGFFLGTDQIWSCIFFAMLASFLYSAALLLTGRATMKTEIPYAPFLLLGTVAATFLVSI